MLLRLAIVAAMLVTSVDGNFPGSDRFTETDDRGEALIPGVSTIGVADRQKAALTV